MQKPLTLLLNNTSKNHKTSSLQRFKAITQQVSSIVFHKSSARAILLYSAAVPTYVRYILNLLIFSDKDRT
jgi:hypothetical protein